MSVHLPALIFAAIILAFLILAITVSSNASTPSQHTSNTPLGRSSQIVTVQVLIVVAGNTTYTSTVTTSLAGPAVVEVVVQPVVIVNGTQTYTTTTTKTTYTEP